MIFDTYRTGGHERTTWPVSVWHGQIISGMCTLVASMCKKCCAGISRINNNNEIIAFDLRRITFEVLNTTTLKLFCGDRGRHIRHTLQL